MRPFLNIPHDIARYPSLGKLEPHDAYHETVWKRLVDRFETRMEYGALAVTSKLHKTVEQVREITQRCPKSCLCSRVLLNPRDLKWDFVRCLVTWNELELERLGKSVCLFI